MPKMDLGNPDVPACVAFRGYILEPPIHSWSDSHTILDYWRKSRWRHNGVFASVVISGDAEELCFITDAFGIATLYYREFAGGVIFSTNTRFLTTSSDRLDYISARILMHCGAVYGNRTLVEEVLRAPAGSVLRFKGACIHHQKWFDDSGLASGRKPVTPAVIRGVENAFQNSIERCLRLNLDRKVLPLSSGFDSRRILAALRSRNVGFHALTVRVYQKGDRDLDARWASAMAESMGFSHQVIDLPPYPAFAELGRLCRALLDAHCVGHTWFLTLYPHLPAESCLLFDGLGGDVLGETGFEKGEYHGLSHELQTDAILNDLISHHFRRVLNARYWPPVELVRNELADFLDPLPPGNNRPDLAFMNMRCRSGTGLCFQRLTPAGHVTVYPYFDLDYVAAALEVNPMEKLPPRSLQSFCLSEFWPRYFRFPGSRNVPGSSLPLQSRPNLRLDYSCIAQMARNLDPSFWPEARKALTLRGYLALYWSGRHVLVSNRSSWWTKTVLTFYSRPSTAAWTVARHRTLKTEPAYGIESYAAV